MKCFEHKTATHVWMVVDARVDAGDRCECGEESMHHNFKFNNPPKYVWCYCQEDRAKETGEERETWQR